MHVIGSIISLLISGLIVGGLGRLAVPGRNPMSLWMTALLGIGGAVIGVLIAALIGGGAFLTIVLEVAAAAGLVYLVSGSRGRRPLRR